MVTAIVDLGRQSLGRALTAAEVALASGLEAIFSTSEHDFERVADDLQRNGVAKPSGATSPWTTVSLHEELRRVNDSLDTAYTGDPARPTGSR